MTAVTAPVIDASPRAGRYLRRLKTIPTVTLLFAALTALLPLVLLVGLSVDAVRFLRHRTPFMATRLTAFGWVYLLWQVLGLTLLFGGWLAAGCGRNKARLARWAYRVQALWTAQLLGAVRRLFGVTLSATGATPAPGPVLVLLRHVSLVDTLLPAHFIARPHQLRLRYVVKRELLADPALDVAGNWLPNCFVDRSGGDAVGAARDVRTLAADMGPGDGALIYPEGTRFTQRKLARAKAKLAKSPDAQLAARSAALRWVLPPRLGGVLALLDGAPDADVVIGAHHGFDGFASVRAIWSGAMVRRQVRVHFWRVPRAEVPKTREARIAWLYDWWDRIDAWVGEQQDDGAAEQP